MNDSFVSSDSVRSGKPLQHLQTVTFDQPLELEAGEMLPSVTVAYETYGELSMAKDNAVLICHAISGDSHVAAHDENDDPGWWDILVGPGKSIDTSRYFVICSNVLGGCRGTTGPNSVNPETGHPYGADFPFITIGDMVEVQRRLIDHLNIDKLLAVIGGSMGGHQTLGWATRYPDRTRAVIPIATSPRLTSQALAFDVVARNAILRDPNYREGQFYDGGPEPTVGLAIARMLGHITYLSREAMTEKFEADRLKPRDIPTRFEKRYSVGSYLAHQGHKFVERFDANSYVTLSLAMDQFDLGATHAELTESLRQSACRWLVISFTSDWLFPPFQSKLIIDALIAADRPVSFCNVSSPSGHDAFLLDDSLPTYGGLIDGLLSHESDISRSIDQSLDVTSQPDTSIFQDRLDYERIVELIPPGASVLDLGCGGGTLLGLLRARGHKRLTGVELDEKAIVRATQRGHQVVQLDLEKPLTSFADKQYDMVVLSQTLPAIAATEQIMDDMLRIGRAVIVSFPNFAYKPLREMLSKQGRSPSSPTLLNYNWWDTPNRRFLSISDFEDFLESRNIDVHRRVALNTEVGTEIEDDPNLNADLAIFVVSR